MTFSYVIVIDQGTHSTRAIIYNREGAPIFESRESIDLNYVDKYKIEQDGNQILESCKAVISNAEEYLQENKINNVVAALTTQRSTVIAWNSSTGDAISPALSWLDTRAEEYLSNLSLSNEDIKHKTGLPVSPHYGASKLRWLIDHNEDVQIRQKQKRLALGPLAAYLIFNLVEHSPSYVDYSNAHRTLLWNLQTKEWDQDLLNAFSLQSSLLPKAVPNAYAYGDLLDIECPLVFVNGDQNSTIYGYGTYEENTTFVNIGTGGFVLVKIGQPILDSKLLGSITYSTNTVYEYSLEGTINGAGAAVSWAKEAWGVSNIESIDWQEVEEVPIYLNTIGGLGSPWWRSDIKSMFLDNKSHQELSPKQCKAALMESIAFLITKNIQEIFQLGIETKSLVVTGGLSSDTYLCQRLADLCKVPVMSSDYKEATSRGAAWLVFGRPSWEPVHYLRYTPRKDEAIHSRYQKFITEIERRVR